MSGTAALDLNGNTVTVGDLNGSANTVVTSSSGAPTLEVGGNSNTDDFYGSLTGSLGLEVTGTHTFCLFGQGQSTYTGATAIGNGGASAQLSACGTDTLSPYSAVTVEAGSTLDVEGLGSSIASLAGTGNVCSYGSGNVSTLTVAQSTDTVFSGTIENNPGHDPVALAMVGSGTLTLTGTNNSSTGGTTIASGTLQTGCNDVLGSGPLTVASGGTLDLFGHSQSVWSLSGSGSIINSVTSTTATVTVNGVNDFTGSHSTKVAISSCPSPLNGLLAVATGPSEIDLSWTAAGVAVTGYDIYRGTAPGAENVQLISTSLTSYRDTGVSPGIQYYYVVLAVNANGVTQNSAECHAITPPLPPPTIGQEPILYWAGNGQLGGSGSWDTTSLDWRQNPNGTGPLVTWQNSDVAVFSGAAGVVVLNSGGISPSAIDFTVGNYMIVRSAGNFPLNLWTAGTTIDVAGGATATIGTPIAFSAGLTFTDSGTLILNAQQPGDYTAAGSMTINGGTLEINHVAASDLADIPLVFSNNATLLPEDGGVVLSGTIVLNSGVTANIDTASHTMSIYANISGGGGLAETGGGKLELYGNNSYSGDTTILSGALAAGSPNALGDGLLIIGSGGSISFGGSALDPAVLAAVDQALGLPAGTTPTSNQWDSLTSLTIDSNRVFTLQGLDSAKNLESLTLVPSSFAVPGHITDLSMLTGSSFPDLTNLTLQDCGLDDTSINTLPNLPSLNLPALKTLDLRYNSINTVPSQVADQPTLTSLLLYGNPLGGSAGQTWYASLSGRLLTVDIAPQDTTGIIANINPASPTTTFTALANAFYDLPIEVYQYLVNTIQYQPYYGAMKGPLAVLQTGTGNDWDTDSLLAGVLEAISTQAQAVGNSTISVTYESGLVSEPIATTEDRLAVQTPSSAYDALYLSGLCPYLEDAEGSYVDNSQVSVAPYIAFNHTWLSVGITSPESSTATNYLLDPSWKLLNIQTGVAGLLDSVPFATNDSGSSLSYLNPGAANVSIYDSESAADYYESAVRSYLATNDPSITIADVPYQGSIQQQYITSLPPSCRRRLQFSRGRRSAFRCRCRRR